MLTFTLQYGFKIKKIKYINVTVTQAHFCKLTIVVIWTGVPLHGQRKEPEQMHLQQHERSEFAALHSPHARKMDCLD